MNKGIARAQASTLMTWADQWGRDDAEGSSEVAFLLARAARMMNGTEDASAVSVTGLPAAPVQSELAGD